MIHSTARVMLLVAAPLLLADAPAGSPAPPVPSAPGVAVAAVKQVSGVRLSKLIGSTVLGDQNQHIGTVDDIIADHQDKLSLVVVQVGGFLGIGSKLIAIPYHSLTWTGGQAMFPQATKQSVQAMPSFAYADNTG